MHNLGDALNSIPLLFAFYIARRAANRRYTYGYGRLEDIAGVFIVISIGFSAAYIIYESVQRLLNPLPLANLEWIALASLVGFVGNELVALMQIRVGKRIGSDAMIADGQHALIDGLTSLAVLIAVIGTLIGLPILDPIVGVVIGIAIIGITWNAIKAVWYRMMDAVDPHLVEHVEAARARRRRRRRRINVAPALGRASNVRRDEGRRAPADTRRWRRAAKSCTLLQHEAQPRHPAAGGIDGGNRPKLTPHD